mgnify:CR=1 FL=1
MRKLLCVSIEYETSIEILLHFFVDIFIGCSTVAYNSVFTMSDQTNLFYWHFMSVMLQKLLLLFGLH